ncbi:alanyl-tRNA editing protein [Aquabacterium sp. A7-Y]|uniref:alanyl-tRNA editing protein n=1 Tax=Aquabacterium sp. A7-Y TaxID=1349605 RepID=UPI0039FBA767
MSLGLCHLHPECFEFPAYVTEQRENAVCLDRSFFYPGGGGQLPDRGVLRWATGQAEVIDIKSIDGKVWHVLNREDLPTHKVVGIVDKSFRLMMCQLHTDLHILNAIVFKHFRGALVTGVQMAEDGTARVDFDLPQVASADLRVLESEVNSVIEAGLPVRELFMPLDVALAEPGLIRSRSVAPPPQADGGVRIIEIEGLDRQACGGTHLTSTSDSAFIRILKIENKGQRNRRVRIRLDA